MRRTRRVVGLLAVLTAFTFVAAACGDDSDSDSSSATTGGADTTEGGAATTGGDSGEALPACGGTSDIPGSADNTLQTVEVTEAAGVNKNVGLMFDITGRGDQSFNDSAAAGLDKAQEDYGIGVSESTPTGDADRAERMNLLIDQGNGLIIGVGFLWGDAITAGTAAAPDTQFAIVDSVVEAPNATSLVFAEEQGSFLVGAAAAMKSQTGKIGFIGGVENELIQKFEAGYVAGATAGQPGHRGRGLLHQPASGLQRLQRRREGQGDRRVDVRERCRHRLRRRWRFR